MTRRIVILTQWFDPEPTFKGLVFARALVEKGFEVRVITGFPNYPGGKIYPNYRLRLVQNEVIDGVHITRVPLYPSHDKSAIKRVFNYGSFCISSLICGLFLVKRSDVIYAYHPPLTTGITAILLKLFKRAPVVYDIQDMWPDTLKATGMLNNERLLSAIGSVCKLVYRYVDHLVVLSPGFKELLKKRGIPDNKISLIYNWADENSLNHPASPPPEDFPRTDRFRVLFAGNLGKAQALETVLFAAHDIKNNFPNVSFIFVGNGVEATSLKKKAEELKLNNTVFIDAVPMNSIGALLQEAEVLLVHLRKNPLFRITIPSKTQAYMAVGKPILMGVDGDAANLVMAARAGRPFESESVTQLVSELTLLIQSDKNSLASMGANGRAYYYEKLSLAQGVNAFSEIFHQVAKPISG